MTPAEVPAEIFDTALKAVLERRAIHGTLGIKPDLRAALAAVLPEIQAQALREFADCLPGSWQRPNGPADAARAHAEHLLECTCADADRLTATTEEPK